MHTHTHTHVKATSKLPRLLWIGREPFRRDSPHQSKNKQTKKQSIRQENESVRFRDQITTGDTRNRGRFGLGKVAVYTSNEHNDGWRDDQTDCRLLTAKKAPKFAILSLFSVIRAFV